MKKCAKCGYENNPRVKFCDLCTQRLDGPPPAAGAAPAGVTFSNKRSAPAPMVERRYVVLPAGAPVPLAPDVTMDIGRDDSCNLKLVSGKVSRHHAELRWNGNDVFVCDLGSQNGTCVNGEKLPAKGMKHLRDKDEVDVGGVPIVYRILGPGVPDSELVPDNRATDLAFEAKNALAGTVDIVSLKTIIERLSTLGATGTLRVESPSAQGNLRMEKGQPVFGVFGKQTGDAAIAAIGGLVEGRFRFDRDV